MSLAVFHLFWFFILRSANPKAVGRCHCSWLAGTVESVRSRNVGSIWMLNVKSVRSGSMLYMLALAVLGRRINSWPVGFHPFSRCTAPLHPCRMTNADQYWPTTVTNTDQWIILNNTDQYQPTLTNTDQHWPVMRSIKRDWLPADAPVSPLQLAKQGLWVPNSPQHLKIIFLPPPCHLTFQLAKQRLWVQTHLK